MEKRIIFNTFVTEFDNINSELLSLREKKLNEIVFVEYVPVLEKMSRAEKIVKSTSLNFDENGQVTGIKLNTPMRNILTLLSFIELKTNLSIDFSRSLETYDLLMTHKDIYTYILGNSIFIEEYNDYKRIVELTLNDIVTNHYETKAFISEQVDKLGKCIVPIIETSLEKLGTQLNDEKTIKRLERFVQKIQKAK